MNSLAFIGSLGAQEMVVIFLIVLLFFGPKKLPSLARSIGKSMGEFRRAKEEFEHEMTRSQDAELAAPAKPAHRPVAKSADAPAETTSANPSVETEDKA
ncbi:twin-arginine translocase TatA/TatE family subunit [Persicirhabdus sediminis]|uniref:Sec-independent protein translocase protein TatA n=2 Tax=Persicirhabdus sediminis TaxID=454144 RepID=A0A8J7MFQ6_9BACT|nr:twin-arginine translocase TatA/TatE family subunit [Persicirhabdus sediminis]